MTGKPTGSVYTLAEASAHLRLTNRGVAKLAKAHGLCMVRGRDILFTDADIEAIKDVLRAPATSPRPATVRIAPAGDLLKDIAWRFGPSCSVDRRQMEVLRALASSRRAMTHKQISRAGPRTIDAFLSAGLAVEVDRDEQGDKKVAITEKGREQIAIVDRWIKLRLKHGKGPGGWGRHLKEKSRPTTTTPAPDPQKGQ